MSRFNTIIIGAGPIGIETASALQQAGLETCIVEAGPIGATISTQFPPATRFFSSPDRLAIAGIAISTLGQEKPTREEYLAYLRSVVATHELDVRTFHEVQRIERLEDCLRVETRARSGQLATLEATNIVIATGGTGKVRTLDIPGEQFPHVSHDLGDPLQYHGRRVLVVGGRNSACEAALRCWRAGAEVHLSYRGSDLHERVKYWIRPELSALIEERHVHAHFRTNLVEITPVTTMLQGIDADTSIELVVDDILLLIGYEHDSTLLRKAGVTILPGQGAPEYNEETMQTNVAGVYVAGTATAGTQERFQVFIENCHVHAHRIAAAITGSSPPTAPDERQLEEN